MGSDTAGSLRVPAAFNGLCAYRPSVGRHSVKGMTPLAASFDVPGVLATSIVDCLAVDDCLRLGQMQTRAAGQARRLQVHVDERVLDAEVTDPAIRHNLLAMAEQLAAKGVTVTYCPVAAVAETIDLIANDHGGQFFGYADSCDTDRAKRRGAVYESAAQRTAGRR